MDKDHYVEWIRGGEQYRSGLMTEEKARTHFRRVRSLADTTVTYLVRQHGDEVVDSYERSQPAPGCGPESLVGAVPYPPDTPSEAELRDPLWGEGKPGSMKRSDGLRRDGKTPEPESAYEAAHSTTHDLIQRLVEKLRELPAPIPDGDVTWNHVKLMNEVNLSLFTLIDFVQKGKHACGT